MKIPNYENASNTTLWLPGGHNFILVAVI